MDQPHNIPTARGLFDPCPGSPRPIRQFVPPKNLDGSADLSAPLELWTEVQRRRSTIIRHANAAEDSDPLVAEVRLHRLRRDMYGDGFLVDKILYAHPNLRPPPPRYNLRDTPQRFRRDAKRIQERRAAKAKEAEADEAAGKAILEKLLKNSDQPAAMPQRTARVKASHQLRVSSDPKTKVKIIRPHTKATDDVTQVTPRRSSREARPAILSASGVQKPKSRAKRQAGRAQTKSQTK